MSGGQAAAGPSSDIFGNKPSTNNNDGDIMDFLNGIGGGGGGTSATSDPFGNSQNKPADPFASTKSDPFATSK